LHGSERKSRAATGSKSSLRNNASQLQSDQQVVTQMVQDDYQ
jgi:hypothetical protein